MAITAEDVRSYPLNVDRRGYNVEEVDHLLDQVAESFDELEATIVELRYQLDNRPAAPVVPVVPAAPAVDEEAIAAAAVARARAEFDRQMSMATAEAAMKEARIAELENAVANAKADGNAIAQALIIAQRSADEILSNANSQAMQIIDDAKEDAAGILARAQEDKQGVEDEIDGLKVDLEDARSAYQDLLRDFIADATTKLAGITEQSGAHAKLAAGAAAAAGASAGTVTDPGSTGRVMSKAQIPVRRVPADTYVTPDAYVTPQTGNVIPVAAMPTPSKVTKDLSGFGDTDSDFLFGDVD